MRAYIIRRLLLIIPTLFILITLVFLSVRFIPGDAIDALVARILMGNHPTAYIDREGLERMLGLDVPDYVQYGRWIGVLPTPDPITGETHFKGLLQGTLGTSLFGRWTVEEKIIGRMAVTIQLGVMAIVITWVIAFPVGIYSAIRQDTAADYVARTGGIIGMSIPNFWLALMIVIFPAIWWGYSPPVKLIPFSEDPLGNLRMFIIPSLILGTAGAAGLMRLTRTMMLEVLRQDYIRTARSKGLKERLVIIRHAIRNTLIPIVTAAGMILPEIVGGAVIMENIFNLPGIGQVGLKALHERDYPVISGMNLFFATIIMINILIIDISYAWLDPRIRYS